MGRRRPAVPPHGRVSSFETRIHSRTEYDHGILLFLPTGSAYARDERRSIHHTMRRRVSPSGREGWHQPGWDGIRSDQRAISAGFLGEGARAGRV